jgi:acetyltransferase
MLGSATAETYAAAIPPLLADRRLDALIVLFVPPVVAGADEVAHAIRETVVRLRPEKPVLAVVISAGGTPATLLEPGAPVATFSYPESAARALGLAASRSEWLRRPAGQAARPDRIDRAGARTIVDEALARGEGWLAPDRARALLEAYGVPLVRERLAPTLEEALTAAGELGLPVVVKTAAAGAHKTESGGVALDLRDEMQVRAAVERIGAPVIVQAYVSSGAELLAGAVQDPVFGPLVAFGPGGVLAELIGSASFRLAPLDDVDAQELVHEGKAGRLVEGFRGAPPADAAALVDLVLRLSALAEDLPEVAELDLNPVIALPDRCVAVDARVRVQAAEPRRSPKTW